MKFLHSIEKPVSSSCCGLSREISECLPTPVKKKGGVGVEKDDKLKGLSAACKKLMQSLAI